MTMFNRHRLKLQNVMPSLIFCLDGELLRRISRASWQQWPKTREIITFFILIERYRVKMLIWAIPAAI